MKKKISWQTIINRVKDLPAGKYYGIPRGGQYIAAATGSPVDDPDQADYIIDDLYDSGSTFRKWKRKYPNKEFLFLFDKRKEFFNTWLIFPWEETDKDIDDHIIRMLQFNNKEVNEENIKLLKLLIKSI